jgi:menaquinone-dependent protoporphyrinogen oxidase
MGEGAGLMTRIMVAYATQRGSTRQVAETVAAVLRTGGARVDVQPVSEVRAPADGFALVVLGAPLYSGRWHQDAHRFLDLHRTELERVPVAVFGMGPRTDNRESWRRSRTQLNRALARRGWLAPIAVAVFGGVDPPDHDGRGPGRDLRDWAAIRAWADSLLALTGSGTPRRLADARAR